MKVLITGDRHWTDPQPIDVVIHGLLVTCRAKGVTLTVLHGNARGVDSLADTWKRLSDVDVRPFPADWAKYPKAAGPIRNRQMLDEKPDLVVAFHDELDGSKGTKDCVNEAVKRGIPVWHLRHVSGVAHLW